MSSGQSRSMATPSRCSNCAATSRSAEAASSTVDCRVITMTTTAAITTNATPVRTAIRPTFDFCGGPGGGPNCCPGAPYCGGRYWGGPYWGGPYWGGPYCCPPYGGTPYVWLP